MKFNFFRLIKNNFSTDYLTKKYYKGEFIKLRDDKFFILSDGKLSIEVTNINLNSFKIAELYKGDIVPPFFILEKIQYFSIDIIADTQVEILEIDKNLFFSKMVSNITDFSMFFDYISYKSSLLFYKILFSTMTIEEKFLIYLNINKNENNIVFIDKNMNELAKKLFTTRTALYKVINNLIKKEIIQKINSKTFKIIKNENSFLEDKNYIEL